MIFFLKAFSYLFLSLFFFNLAGCSSEHDRKKNILSSPDWRTTPYRKDHKVLLIASTNNFQGQLKSLKKKVGAQSIPVGGTKTLTKYFEILKSREKEILLLDSGELFSNSSSIQETISFYKKNKYDAIGLSLNDFLELKKINFLASPSFPIISSNLTEIQTQRAPFKLPSYKIIKKNSLKIAIFSLISFIPEKMEMVQKKNLLYFEDPVSSFLKFRHQLQRKEKINLYIALVNFPNPCSSKNDFEEKKNKKINNLKCRPEYQSQDHLTTFIKRLPKDKIDLIIASGSEFAEGFISDIPILQNPGKGQFFSRAKIIYDLKNKKILKDKTKIFPPVETCHFFLMSTEDCHQSDHQNRNLTKSQIIPAKFLGHSIQ